MMNANDAWKILSYLCLIPAVVTVTTEERLLSRLFESYNRVARPVLHANETAQVYLSLGLSTIDELDTRHETLISSGWVTLTWTDPRLVWDPEEYDNLDVIVVHPDMLWLPSCVLDNVVGRFVYIPEHYTMFRVSLYNDGTCIWEPGNQFRSRCAVDVSLYPFDTQKCVLVFANWVYTGNKVNLTLAEDAGVTITEVAAPNIEWDIVATDIFRRDFYFECCPEPYPDVHFVLTLRRKPLFYVVNFLLPSVLLGVLVLLVFRLPPESGEKISMAVTLLLSYSVLILMISESVPHSSQGVPLIVTFLLLCMLMTAVSVVTSVCLLQLYHQGSDKAPPQWLTTLLFVRGRHSKASKWKSNKKMPDNTPGVVSNGYVFRLDQDVQSFDSGVDIKGAHKTKDTDQADPGKLIYAIEALHRAVKQTELSVTSKQKDEQALAEWRQVVKALDNIFFWLCACFLLIIVIILVAVPLMSQ